MLEDRHPDAVGERVQRRGQSRRWEVRARWSVSKVIFINRPVEEVFDLVADERNEPRFNPRMRRAEKISEGPIGVGTRFRAETVKHGPSGWSSSTPATSGPRGSLRPRACPHMDIRYTLTFEPVPEGTWMRWSGDLEPLGILKVITPLVAWMGQR